MKTTSSRAIMAKPQNCEDISPAIPEFIGPSDNSSSRYFCERIFQHSTFFQLSQQDNVRIFTNYDSWIFTVFGVISTVALCYTLSTWYRKYRLRYLLRLCFLVFFVFLSLNISCLIKSCFQNWLDEDPEAQKCVGTLPTIISAMATTAMLSIRFYWSVPLNIKRTLNSAPSSNRNNSTQTVRKTAKQLTEEKLQSGILKELPPVFPNGWIPLIESSQLLVKTSKTIAAIGKKFCVFRGSDETAYVVDAYCPHLGAELAAGGRVLNNCIECPFHGWQFHGQTGQCSKIPYADKVPEVAKIKTWPSCEKNGFIYVWYHAENEEPSWEMPSVINVESGIWSFRGRTEHEVHCHIQEIPENGADIAHLHVIHSQSIFAGLKNFGCIIDSILNCVEHEWQPCGWKPDEERPHVGMIKLNQRTRICGASLPLFRLKMNIEQIGPATVHLHLDSSFGRGVLMQNIIPEGPLSHRIIHLLYTESRFGQFPADLLILSEAIMLDRDIAVWNNKRFLRRPVLVKEDKLITRFRRWYSQFYSEHSPTLKDMKERTLEW